MGTVHSKMVKTGARFYLADLNDNIGLLAARASAIDSHTFEAFGVPVSGGTPTVQPFGYGGDAGYYTEPIGGLPILWNRIYDTNAGQFPSRDPIGFRGQDWQNLYRYVKNNPLRSTDPTGLSTVTALIGCIFGGSTNLILDIIEGDNMGTTLCQAAVGCATGSIVGFFADIDVVGNPAALCTSIKVAAAINTVFENACISGCAGGFKSLKTFLGTVVCEAVLAALQAFFSCQELEGVQAEKFTSELFAAVFGFSINSVQNACESVINNL